MNKKDIIQLVKKLVKEDAYGSATLTTQGAPRTRAVAPAGEDPYTGRVEYPYTVGAKTKNGMMEEDESTSFKVVNADTGKTIDFGIDQAKAEEIVAAAKEDNINAKVVKMKDGDDVGKLKESQGTLASDMLNYADQYHMELVDTMKGVSTHPDKRTGGFRILFPHYNGPDYTGAMFGKDVSMKIEKSKAAAKAAALKTYTKFQDQIEDYEITDKSRAGVHGSIHLWVMPKDMKSEDYKPSHRAYNVIDKSNNDKIVAKELSRDKALELAHTNKDYMISATDRLAETPMFRTGIKQDMAPEGMAERIKYVFNKVNGAQHPVQTPEWHKNRFKNKYGISFPETLKGINKDQAIAMNKYANDMKITEADLKNPKKADLNKDGKLSSYEKTRGSAIEKNLDEDITDDISKAEDEVATATQAKADAESKVADAVKKKADAEKSALEENSEESMNNADIGILNDLVQKYSPEKLKITIDILSRGTTLSSQGVDRVDGPYGDKSVDMENMMESYIKERGDSNLMEHMDKHRKRAVLMEGAMKKFFEMFDMGKTDEEIVQDYAQRGTQVPEPFVSKARKQYEGLKKMKLELEMSEKEYKNSATQIVNNPATGEMDGSTTMEDKQLASGLFNEEY